MSRRAPYGTWTSIITSDEVTARSILIDEIIVDDVRGTVYHLESRPAEGRTVLVKTNEAKDVVPPGFNVRTRVQEYGGGAAVIHDGIAYVSNFADSHIYRIQEDGNLEVVTPASTVWRYADFSVHPHHPHLLAAVLEDHTEPSPSGVQTRLVVLDTSNKQVATLVQGADFYNAPRFSPNGSTLAWNQWLHPDMPWEGGHIFTAPVVISQSDEAPKGVTLSIGSIGGPLAGEQGKVAANYPNWSPSGSALHFMSDVSGFANPWVWGIAGVARPALPTPIQEEFGKPAWQLRKAFSASLDEDRIVLIAHRAGRSILYVLDNGILREVISPYTSIMSLHRVGPGKIVFVGRTATTGTAVVQATFADHGRSEGDTAATDTASFLRFETLHAADSDDTSLKPEVLSTPEALTVDGPTGSVHIIYWPPHNPEYEGSDCAELPPCIFSAHGGPTGQMDASLNPNIAFYTSRGWGWCEVNYGGSSGYGREYTERLRGKWGLVDVQDVLAAAHALSSGPAARVDAHRLAIRGRSSGGFTVLATLTDKDQAGLFGAGTSYYGVSDLRKLAEDMHKFESRYIEQLIGGTYQDVPHVYTERSPVTNAERIVSPLLILQGSDDRVVPPDQSEMIVKAIKDRGGDVEYKIFAGEGHGFRQAANLKNALESELRFYERIFGLTS